MLAWLHRWIYTDFWVPVWPNLAAAVVVAAWVTVKLKALRELHERHHAELKKQQAGHHAEHMQAIGRALKASGPADATGPGRAP